MKNLISSRSWNVQIMDSVCWYFLRLELQTLISIECYLLGLRGLLIMLFCLFVFAHRTLLFVHSLQQKGGKRRPCTIYGRRYNNCEDMRVNHLSNDFLKSKRSLFCWSNVHWIHDILRLWRTWLSCNCTNEYKQRVSK